MQLLRSRKGCEEMEMAVSMRPDMSVDELKSFCRGAAETGKDAVCVPQWLVSTAAEELGGSGVCTATILGLPGGTTSTFAKFAEAKQAIANGAGLVIVPVNMELVRRGDQAGAKSDLVSVLVAGKTTMARKCGARAAALIDADCTPELLEGAVEGAFSAGVETVFLLHADKAPEELLRKRTGVLAL